MRDHRDAAREALIQWIRRYLGGEVGLIEASREIWRLGEELQLDHQLLAFFKGVDSQTDHLPVGDQRVRWNSEALLSKDAEVAAFEGEFSAEARDRCGWLLWVLRAIPGGG